MKPQLLLSDLHELVIFAPVVDNPVNDFDIMAVMVDLYDNDCPFQLMEKVMDDFVATDRALVFCGSRDVCERGRALFEDCDIRAEVREV